MTFWLVLASAAALACAQSVTLNTKKYTQTEKFVCVEWANHPHGYPAPIYYWNSAHKAYIWHGADCSMSSAGKPFLCDSSRIHGEEGSDYAAYKQVQGTDDLAQRSRMAFFSSCRVTVNSIQQDADGAWIFRQNDSTEESAGKCMEANPWDCTGKGFSAGITVSAGSRACLNSPLAAQSFRGYFAAIESDLVDGVNPVLNMPTAFKAMADGGLECNPVDKLPKLPVGEDSMYGVMSYDNSLSSQLVQRVMPKAKCYTEFNGSLTIDGNQNCTDLAAGAGGSLKEVTVCEEQSKGFFDYVGRKDRSTTITCSSGSIKIADAFYGRKTCANSLCYSPDFTNCAANYCDGGQCTCGGAGNAKKYAAQRCDGKSSCSVQASHSAMSLFDPCNGENKYLVVQYSCTEEYTPSLEGRRRRLAEAGGSAGGTSVLAISALPSNGGGSAGIAGSDATVVAASLTSTVLLSVAASLLAGRFAC